MDIITVSDLPAAMQSAEMINLMVDGANARAARVAPCLSSTDPEPTEALLAEARLILVGAIQRWSEAGSGALQSQQTGPFGITVDTRQRTGFNLWPTEIKDLQDLCRAAGTSSGAFSVTPSGCAGGHMDICSANRYVDQNGNVVFGGAFCSCGAEYTNYEYPLYEGGILSGDYY